MIIQLISTILNILFEIFYLYFNITKVKDLKDKRIRLFLAILLSYMISSIAVGFLYSNQIYFFIILVALIYFSMKKLYGKKAQIIDIFFITYIITFMNLTSMITTTLLGYNMPMIIINRVILAIMIFPISKFLTMLYNKYISNWNRKEGNKIKSVSIRSSSLLILNMVVSITAIYIIYYLIAILKFK